MGTNATGTALLGVIVGVIAGASGSRLVQYGILGGAAGVGFQLVAVHSFVEATLRPVRLAIAGDTAIGDSMPRSRPSFANWAGASVVGVAFTFALGGAMLAALVVLAGCASGRMPTYQGWIEAELIFVGPDETGRIETLTVREGDQVELR